MTAERPPGVPSGARLVTLARLHDDVAKPGGSLRIGPRGSYLRMTMRIFPLGLRGTIAEITAGVNQDHGERVFALRYAHGTRNPGRWKWMTFILPGAAERELWIWTLNDQQLDRELRLRRLAAAAEATR